MRKIKKFVTPQVVGEMLEEGMISGWGVHLVEKRISVSNFLRDTGLPIDYRLKVVCSEHFFSEGELFRIFLDIIDSFSRAYVFNNGGYWKMQNKITRDFVIRMVAICRSFCSGDELPKEQDLDAFLGLYGCSLLIRSSLGLPPRLPSWGDMCVSKWIMDVICIAEENTPLTLAILDAFSLALARRSR